MESDLFSAVVHSFNVQIPNSAALFDTDIPEATEATFRKHIVSLNHWSRTSKAANSITPLGQH